MHMYYSCLVICMVTYIYANSDYEICENMKLYVGKLVHCFTLNNLKLNIEKTKIYPYFNTIIMNSIHIDNVNIELVNYYIFLGITLDINLNMHYILIY